MAEGTSRRVLENERVQVTEWRLPPGATTGRHRHELDLLVMPMTSGRLKLHGDEPGEAVTAEIEAGRPFWRNAGVEHDVENVGDGEFVFVETELKG